MRGANATWGRMAARLGAALLVIIWPAAAGMAAQAGNLPPHFQPLAFLLGACWRGTFADGRTTDVRCVEPVFGGKFLRERHVVRRAGQADYQGETVYHWDPEARKIRYTYWNSSGGVSTGTMEVQGARRVFPAEIYKGSGGRTREFRTTWHVMGDTAWTMVTEERRPGEPREWIEAWRVSFVRDSS